MGRTFKDYEDQLDSLKRDNFNLKLRIYFLEEKMGSSAPDQNAIRDSIELKVLCHLMNVIWFAKK